MGQIIFHCTHCGTKLSAELEEAGAEFECPQCQRSQAVPGGHDGNPAKETAPGTQVTPIGGGGGAPVIRIPKRKIVMSSGDDDEVEEVEYIEEAGGSGLSLFAIALGTSGLILCGISMVWMLMQKDLVGKDWWIGLIVFLSTFLMGLMGLVIAQLARAVVRLSDHVANLIADEEE